MIEITVLNCDDIVTGGYPQRGIIEFSAKDNTRKFKITIEEQQKY